jgi:ArsR family transcriptional regulator
MADPIYEAKAQIYKALGHPIRIQVVEMLAQGEKSVSEIVAQVGAKEANLSRHLGVLKSAGIIKARKEGLNVYYQLIMPCLVSMFSCVNSALVEKAEFHREIAERLK